MRPESVSCLREAGRGGQTGAGGGAKAYSGLGELWACSRLCFGLPFLCLLNVQGTLAAVAYDAKLLQVQRDHCVQPSQMTPYLSILLCDCCCVPIFTGATACILVLQSPTLQRALSTSNACFSSGRPLCVCGPEPLAKGIAVQHMCCCSNVVLRIALDGVSARCHRRAVRNLSGTLSRNCRTCPVRGPPGLSPAAFAKPSAAQTSPPSPSAPPGSPPPAPSSRPCFRRCPVRYDLDASAGHASICHRTGDGGGRAAGATVLRSCALKNSEQHAR
eukprot:49884-Chlamydomonas_euryale.AAC.2